MKASVDRGFDRLEEIDDRYFAIVFFAGLLAYTVILVVEAVDYNPDARLFPLIVGVPLALLIVANIVLQLLADRLDLGLVGLFDDVRGFELPETAEAVDRAPRYRRELAMIGWVVVLVVLTWLFGNYLAIVGFVFAFVAVNERDLRRATVATVLTFLLVFVLFDIVLGASLWRGVLPLRGVLP